MCCPDSLEHINKVQNKNYNISAYAHNVANVIYTIGTLCTFIDANTVGVSESHKNSWCVILYEENSRHRHTHSVWHKEHKQIFFKNLIMHCSTCSKNVVNTKQLHKHLNERDQNFSPRFMFTCTLFEYCFYGSFISLV